MAGVCVFHAGARYFFCVAYTSSNSMNFFKFVFSFLYSRNWFSGEVELSTPRVALFSSMLFLILLGALMATILQTPVEYARQDTKNVSR
jgi:hypothetical protein